MNQNNNTLSFDTSHSVPDPVFLELYSFSFHFVSVR